MWKFPWKLNESLFFGFGLLLTGFLIEIISDVKISAPSFPNNMYLVIGFAILLILTHIFFRKNPFVAWLSSVNCAISSIVFYTGLTLLMGLIPQVHTSNTFILHLGLNRITSTWVYLILLIFFAISLGLVTLKRLHPINRKNIGFFFNHFGLWLTILSANLGVGDLQQLKMIVYEGQTEWKAVYDNQQVLEMPIAIKLNDFDIEEFNPKLLIYNNKTSELVSKPYLIDTVKNSFKFKDFEIKVVKFHKYSVWFADAFQAMIDEGNPPSALVEIYENNKFLKKAWISCGSFKLKEQFVSMNSEFTLVMSKPEPKRFFSDVTIYTKDGETRKEQIEVNKPIEIIGWNIYQASYDDEKGKYSNYSVFQFVKDPWLPVVYVGIFLMIIGVGFIIFRGEDLKH